MSKKKKSKKQENQLGHLEPRYDFVLNPYKDMRFTKCPQCEELTKLRKFSLHIHLKPLGSVVLGKTCRFCPDCEMLIVHQDELENELIGRFGYQLEQISNEDYFVFGTVERKTWRKGMREELTIEELLENSADFASYSKVSCEPSRWELSEKKKS